MIILDRLEETLAVLETDDGMVNVPRELLPADVREGDVLRQAADGTYTTDTAATQARRGKTPGTDTADDWKVSVGER